MEPCAQRIPRARRVCAITGKASTRQAVTLAPRGGTRFDDTAGGTVFLGIRTIQERGRGMVPLYAARVQDLGTDDRLEKSGRQGERWQIMCLKGRNGERRHLEAAGGRFTGALPIPLMVTVFMMGFVNNRRISNRGRTRLCQLAGRCRHPVCRGARQS